MQVPLQGQADGALMLSGLTENCQFCLLIVALLLDENYIHGIQTGKKTLSMEKTQTNQAWCSLVALKAA